MASIRTFDALGYAKLLASTKLLASKGIEAKIAEALAEANHEYLINVLPHKEFVHSKLEKVHQEIVVSENRLLKSIGEMPAFTVGAILAGIPIVLALAQPLTKPFTANHNILFWFPFNPYVIHVRSL